MPSRTDWVVSSGMLYSRSEGKFFLTSSMSFVTPSTAAIAFDPGSWYRASTADGLPFNRPAMV